MASLYSKSLNFLKGAWATQPVLFVSTVMGALGPLIVFLSPLSEKSVTAHEIPTRYPYPANDDKSRDENPDS